MISIIIDKQSYMMPTIIGEVTTKMGMEIEKLINEDYNGNLTIECTKWIMAILCNCDYNEIDKVRDEQIKLVIDNHCYFQQQNLFMAKYIIYKHIIYELRDFDKKQMTVKDYGELDEMLKKPFYYYNDIFDILYQKANNQIQYKLRLIIKNYKSIDDIPYMLMKSVIYNNIQYKINLLKKYKTSVYDDEIPIEQQDNNIELSAIEKEFGFYHTLMTASNNDIKLAEWWLKQDIRRLFQYIRYLNMIIQTNHN